MNTLIEIAVIDLIEHKAVHKKKGTVMGEETWSDITQHMIEEVGELHGASETVAFWEKQQGLVHPFSAECIEHNRYALQGAKNNLLEELGDIYGLLVHATIKAGYSMKQVEERELVKLKERFIESSRISGTSEKSKEDTIREGQTGRADGSGEQKTEGAWMLEHIRSREEVKNKEEEKG